MTSLEPSRGVHVTVHSTTTTLTSPTHPHAPHDPHLHPQHYRLSSHDTPGTSDVVETDHYLHGNEHVLADQPVSLESLPPSIERPNPYRQPPSYRRYSTVSASNSQHQIRLPPSTTTSPAGPEAAELASSIDGAGARSTATDPHPAPSAGASTGMSLDHPKVATYFWYGFLCFPLWIWGMLHLIPGIGLRVPKNPTDELTKPRLPLPLPSPPSADQHAASVIPEPNVVARPPSYCESLRTLEQSYPPTQYSALVALRKEEIKWAMRCLYTLATFGSCIGVVIVATLKFVQSQNDVQPQTRIPTT